MKHLYVKTDPLHHAHTHIVHTDNRCRGVGVNATFMLSSVVFLTHNLVRTLFKTRNHIFNQSIF